MITCVADRRRRQIGVSEASCDICGVGGLPIIESRSPRRGLALVNPLWRGHRRVYQLCPSCGMKYLLDAGHRV